MPTEQQYFATRANSQGERIQGPEIELQFFDAETCEAWRCGRELVCDSCLRSVEKQEQYRSIPANYLTPQPTGNIVADYITGGTWGAPRFRMCSHCWKANKDAD